MTATTLPAPASSTKRLWPVSRNWPPKWATPATTGKEARQFCKALDKDTEPLRHYNDTLLFGITMLEHSEGADWTEDDEFAWHFDEFPLAIAVTGDSLDLLQANMPGA